MRLCPPPASRSTGGSKYRSFQTIPVNAYLEDVQAHGMLRSAYDETETVRTYTPLINENLGILSAAGITPRLRLVS